MPILKLADESALRYNRVQWHPTDPNVLAVATDGAVFLMDITNLIAMYSTMSEEKQVMLAKMRANEELR